MSIFGGEGGALNGENQSPFWILRNLQKENNVVVRKQNKLIKDKHERYEIAFDGEQNLKKFVGFLSELCDIIEEDSIYLIVGDESYLVKPKKN